MTYENKAFYDTPVKMRQSGEGPYVLQSPMHLRHPLTLHGYDRDFESLRHVYERHSSQSWHTYECVMLHMS